MAAKTLPYGSWVSPISSKLVSEKSVSFKEVHVDWDENYRDTVYWTESKSDEGGRCVVCSQKRGGDEYKSWTPKRYDARTKVHEYGGGATFVYQGKVYFSNFTDQALYRQDSPEAEPVRVTPEGSGWRYADGQFHSKHNKIYCVREDHSGIEKKETKEAVNCVVVINPEDGTQRILAQGSDFYSCPRVSPDGKKIAWVQWNHPNMPWDSTALLLADLSEDGSQIVSGSVQQIAGGEDISIMLPSWTYDNELLYIGDQTDWWNLYHVTSSGEHVNLLPKNAECGGPHWSFGQTPYMIDPRKNGNIFMVYGKETGIYNLKTKSYREVKTGFTFFQYINFGGDGFVYALVGSPTKSLCIVQINTESEEVTVLRESKSIDMDTGYFSIPEELTWETTGNETTHGFFYPPTNKDFKAPDGTCSPLLVKNHGGPTDATTTVLNLSIQYFTSRGMAVLDMNYRGSTGYGKKYRHRLRRSWGIVDVDDSCSGALYLAKTGRVDKNMLCIDGNSAGGYTALAAITFRDVFRAGVSHYGVADLGKVAEHMHKFESRYLDMIIGPYKTEDDKEVYKNRSPIYNIDQMNSALALFQGDKDTIVPPIQAEMMYDAVRAKGLPTMYVLFEGEHHGFKRAENIQTALDGEFYFYSKVLGFEAAEKHINIPIENLRNCDPLQELHSALCHLSIEKIN